MVVLVIKSWKQKELTEKNTEKIFINMIESKACVPNSLNTGTVYRYLATEMQRIIFPLNTY